MVLEGGPCDDHILSHVETVNLPPQGGCQAPLEPPPLGISHPGQAQLEAQLAVSAGEQQMAPPAGDGALHAGLMGVLNGVGQPLPELQGHVVDLAELESHGVGQTHLDPAADFTLTDLADKKGAMSFEDLAQTAAMRNNGTTEDLLKKVGQELHLRGLQEQSSVSASPASSPGLLSPHGAVDSPSQHSPLASPLGAGVCVGSIVGETQMSLIDRSEGLNLNEIAPNAFGDLPLMDNHMLNFLASDAMSDPLTSDAFTSDAVTSDVPDSPLTSPHRCSDVSSVTSPIAVDEMPVMDSSADQNNGRKAVKHCADDAPGGSAHSSDVEEGRAAAGSDGQPFNAESAAAPGFVFTKFGSDVGRFSGDAE